MKQIRCTSVGNFKCTVLLSCVLLVWMALFPLCCIENSNCYKIQKLLTSTVSLSSLAFGFLNKIKTISSGLLKTAEWAASFQQQYVCGLDGISLALLWNHLICPFPIWELFYYIYLFRKIPMSLYSVLWSEQNILLKCERLLLQLSKANYMPSITFFWPQRAIFWETCRKVLQNTS